MKKRWSELREWGRFLKVLFRLTWRARGETPCRQKIRRIVRDALKELAV